MRKYTLLTLFQFVAQILISQCPNDNTFNMDLTPTGQGNTQTSTCTFGGEYNTANVTAGVSYTFSTCNAGYDTQITLINDSNGNVEGYNDDFCGLQSQIDWTATYSGVVRVLVDAYFCTDNATCTEISVTQNTGSASNPCSNARPAACGSTVQGTTVGDPAPSFGTCGTTVGTGGADWYLIAGDGNTWTAETVNGTNYDTKIWVYTGNCTNLICVDGDDDSGAGTLSRVSFQTTPNRDYYIIVGGFGTFEGDYTMTLTNDVNCASSNCNPPPAPQTNNDTICGAGLANLTATPSMGGTIQWYDALGNLLGSGPTFNAPISSTTNFYAQENVSGSSSPSSLATTYIENNGQSGVMFDITAINAVTIQSFETNVDAVGDIEIYHLASTHVGNTTNAAAWTLIGTASNVANSPAGTPTPIPINININIPAGQTHSFYITFSNGTFMNYTNGTAVGNIFSADANIQVKEGIGKSYPFGLDFSPRVFNGTVNYTAGSICSSPQSTATAFVTQTMNDPVAIDDIVCNGELGTAGVMSMSGSTNPVMNWYTAPTGGNLLGAGMSYTTPPMTNTVTYYVEEQGTPGSGPGSLLTTWGHNNGQSGVMLDINAINAVTIDNFETNVDVAGDYEIYTKTGTHVGFEANPGAWTLVGSATGVANNPAGTSTPIPINVNTSIPAGQTQAFYITFSNSTGMNYTNGTALGAVFSSDANIEILEGSGKGYPFGATFRPRVFNGVVNYSASSGCGTSSRVPVVVDVRRTQYSPVSTTTTTNNNCTINEAGVDWTYFYDNANPDDLLFAIAKDPNNLGNNTFDCDVEITVNTNPTTTGFYLAQDVTQPSAHFVMGRYWNVNITSGNLVDPVWVRFYYDPAEKARIMTEAINWIATYGGNLGSFTHFKTVGSNFDPALDLHPGGILNSIELTNFIDNQSSTNSMNYVEYRDVTSFSGGSITLGSTLTVLDIELLSFTADKLDHGKATIQWAVEDYDDLSHFELYHGTDPQHMNVIHLADNQFVQDYQFTHSNMKNGTNYYRLKSIYVDGRQDWSEIRALENEQTQNVINIQPNPFSDQFIFSIECKAANPIRYQIYNSIGELIVQKEIASVIGLNQVQINTQDWASGNYILKVQSNNTVHQEIITKK